MTSERKTVELEPERYQQVVEDIFRKELTDAMLRAKKLVATATDRDMSALNAIVQYGFPRAALLLSAYAMSDARRLWGLTDQDEGGFEEIAKIVTGNLIEAVTIGSQKSHKLLREDLDPRDNIGIDIAP